MEALRAQVEAVRDGTEFLVESLRVVGRRTREGGAQVECLAEAVIELLVLVDVEATFEEEGGHRLNDARAFDARQCEHELLRPVLHVGLRPRQRAGR